MHFCSGRWLAWQDGVGRGEGRNWCGGQGWMGALP